MSGILSALSSAISPDAVIVLTDGAVYDRDGTLLKVARKVAVSERLPLAVAYRGNLDFGEDVSQRIIAAAERSGFDQMLAEIAAALPWLPSSPMLEVLIAGVSETAGPMHRMFQNRPAKYGCAPSTLIDPGPLHWGFGTDGRAITLQAMGVPAPAGGQTIQAWLSMHGVSIFEYFRNFPVPIDPFDANTDRQHLIGGILDITVVKRGSVSTTMLHRWPDKIGEKMKRKAT
ncbi:hypothetical protein EFV37_13160 [Mesorhizobium loti]|uniref:Uncharacterized protein n=1 Tax=Mesorhizobium jarvisii TaxID=1777867 RepID=A0A6M7TDS6_9HYPH|nr:MULTISPECIES: hypothetical protein [Mesorhizobium]OBQ58032.1 hypothetical protein A9K72_27900 [Mesorhizobium loti]QKC63144.1 hypothetical protein EB229_13150 [Mesorhizobium jarvisii]QKD09055.1 hypothetical protein EFV37_13160 [Mesorhizobium loti]RJT30151.1 hypothetical protein D3242_25885 [Mesorhizobium jarvisii]